MSTFEFEFAMTGIIVGPMVVWIIVSSIVMAIVDRRHERRQIDEHYTKLNERRTYD